jgi:hypothetical protein
MLFLPLFFWSISYRDGLRLGMMLMISNTTNMILKLSFRTPRPYWVNPDVLALRVETSFGMPSGHSQNAAGLWGLFGHTRTKKWVRLICYLTIFLIGLSRIHLGVHYLHDVLLGWLTGALLVVVALKYEKPIAKKFVTGNSSNRINLTMIISAAMIFLPLLLVLISRAWSLPEAWIVNSINAAPDTQINPMSVEGAFTVAGTTFGTLLGLTWFMEKYQGIPDAGGTVRQKALRYLAGAAGLAVIYLGMKYVTPEGESLIALLMRFIRYGLLGAWISGGAPWLFRHLKWMQVEKLEGIG